MKLIISKLAHSNCQKAFFLFKPDLLTIFSNINIRKSILYIVTMLIVSSTHLYAQRRGIELISGDITPLKTEKSLNIEFSYENMSVNECKSEKEYVQKMTSNYSDSKKEKWLKKWDLNRSTIWQRDCVKPIHEKILQYGVVADTNLKSSAKYTMLIQATHIETGWSAFITIEKTPWVFCDIIIYESDNKSNVIAKLSGIGEGTTTIGVTVFERVWFSYMDLGKLIGQYLKKKLYK